MTELRPYAASSTRIAYRASFSASCAAAGGGVGIDQRVDEFDLVDIEQAIGVARQVGGPLERHHRGFRVVRAHEADAEAVQRRDLLLVGQRRLGLQDAQGALVILDGAGIIAQLVVDRGEIGEWLGQHQFIRAVLLLGQLDQLFGQRSRGGVLPCVVLRAEFLVDRQAVGIGHGERRNRGQR